MKILTQRNTKITFYEVLLTIFFCGNDEFSKWIAVFKGENAANKFIEAILKEYQYCKKVLKKHFNKNLIMGEKEKEQFQSSNTC